MATKKRRKGSSRKPTRRPATKPRAQKPYLWDRVLAAYSALSCCCLTSILSLVSAAGFGVAFAKPFREGVKEYSSSVAPFVKPENGFVIGVFAAALAILSFWMVVALWKSRKWSIWVVLATHLPGAVYSFAEGGVLAGLPGLLVAVYCLLRVTNTIGPK